MNADLCSSIEMVISFMSLLTIVDDAIVEIYYSFEKIYFEDYFERITICH